jgi:ribonucleotide monophosphatase NagD (HAD superfamily)
MAEQFDELKQKRLFILDMDGTFYLGDRLIPGSLEFLERLREKEVDFLFFTNNSSAHEQFYKKSWPQWDVLSMRAPL